MVINYQSIFQEISHGFSEATEVDVYKDIQIH